MKKKNIATLFLVIATSATMNVLGKSKPNVLIIQTDEHNFRTLGCYRDLLDEEQAFVWGKGVKVDTPHLDRLADEGAICTSFYATSPVCTPSRASFISGLYPIATGSHRNDLPLHDGLETFATVLAKEGYATSYLGKWHLDGDAKPGIAPERKFGFTDNRYMINRGHWKGLADVDGKTTVLGLVPETQKAHFNARKATTENYTTDYLTNRTLEILERDKDKPFCLMVSFPDPHDPNSVRAPYAKMYNNLPFTSPKTMDIKKSDMPKWARKKLEKRFKKKHMSDYFGMVKCIDDNVGRLLKFLEDNELDQNTIVIFTADHGDLLYEHNRRNKGVPFEASALIPFLIRWPAKIVPGKIINKAYTNADFTPTLLGMIGVPQIKNVHGVNDAKTFISKDKVVNDDKFVYMTAPNSNWVSLVNDRYKLVLSAKDKPWLFDLKRDPDELVNFAKNREYRPIVSKMTKELVKQLKKYKDPALKKKLIYKK